MLLQHAFEVSYSKINPCILNNTYYRKLGSYFVNCRLLVLIYFVNLFLRECSQFVITSCTVDYYEFAYSS